MQVSAKVAFKFTYTLYINIRKADNLYNLPSNKGNLITGVILYRYDAIALIAPQITYSLPTLCR